MSSKLDNLEKFPVHRLSELNQWMRAQGQSCQCLAAVGMEGGREREFLKRSQGMELGPCQLMLTSATALQTGPVKPIWLLYRLFDSSSWEDLVLVAYVVECGIHLTLQWTTFKVRLISRYPWILPQHEHAHVSLCDNNSQMHLLPVF